jgi:hypothetical protein
MSAPERLDPPGYYSMTVTKNGGFVRWSDYAEMRKMRDSALTNADTLRAERDALAARVERLEGALRLCPPNRPQMTGDEFRKAVDTWWALHARAALSAAQD